jgi:hypothetical protein
MSLENWGVFQLLNNVSFQIILGFYNSREWGHYLILTIDSKYLTLKLHPSSSNEFVYHMRLLHSYLARSLDL